MTRNKSQFHFVKEVYKRLYDRFGPQSWWPADSDFEVIVGAVLTQNTNWKNVQKAILNLKQADCLSLEKLHAMPHEQLAGYIKPAGYFNIKAKRLRHVVAFIVERFNGSLQQMRQEPLEELRLQLLSVNGVGPETADSILLYALGKPMFVVDAYTKRFLLRHNWVSSQADYHDIQKIFINALEADEKIFNEYHALIVQLGKEFCKTTPDCEDCPLVNLNYDLTQRCERCYRSYNRNAKTRISNKKENLSLCEECKDLVKE